MANQPQKDNGPESKTTDADDQHVGTPASAGDPAPAPAATGAAGRTANQAKDWSKTMVIRYGPSVKERGAAAVGWLAAKARTTAGRRVLGGLVGLITLRSVFRARRRRRRGSPTDEE